MRRKAAEAARNINRIFAQETISERIAENQFQKFRSGNEGLDDEEDCGWKAAINNKQLKESLEADLPATIWEFVFELNGSDMTVSSNTCKKSQNSFINGYRTK